MQAVEKLMTNCHKEAKSRKGPESTFTGFFGESSILIDYIFAQFKNIEVKETVVIEDKGPNGYYPSDHRPVMATLEFWQ